MSKLTRKILSVSLSVTTVVWLTGSMLPAVGAQSSADLQAMINSLLVQIQALQAQLTAQQVGAPSSYTFTRDLTVGSKGADVTALQSVLISGGYLKISAPTAYFGPLTKTALAAWQAAKGVTPSVGYFGAKTRAALAVSGGAPAVGVPSGALSVSLVGPVASTIPSGSLYNSVLKLAFNGGAAGGSVSSITVTRGGFIANTRITGVSAWDDIGGMRYGNIVSSLTSDGKATLSFGANPFVVPAGQTKYLTIAVNLDTTATSASFNFSVNAASDLVAVGGVAVSGVFPIAGPSLTVVDGSASIADLRVSDQSVAGTNLASVQSGAYDGNVAIGDTQREVGRIRLAQNNSREAVSLKSITVYVGGTIQEATDLKNWKLYSPEGNVLASADKPVDRYVIFSLVIPYTIDKGLSKDFSVKTDFIDGSSRYLSVYIQNDYDIMAKGAVSGAFLAIVDGNGLAFVAADTQVNAASAYFKMKSGNLTVSRTATSPSGSNIAPSSQNVILAEFDLKASGEKLEIRKMGLSVQYVGVVLAGSLVVKDKATGENYLSISADTTGIQSTSTASSTTLLAYQQNLSSYITVESNQTKTLQIVGTVGSSATSTSNYTVNVGQFYMKRFSTNDFTTLAAGPYPGNTLSVGDVGLTIVKSTSFPNMNRSAGSIGTKVAEFVFQASAADDVRISSINFDVTTSTNFQNMVLKDELGNLLGSIGTPGASGNTYSVNVTVTKNQTKVLSVYADILASATTTSIVSVSSAGVSGSGVSSGKALSSTPSAAVVGQTITLAIPTLTIARDSSASASKIVLAGVNGVELNRIKFSPTAENMTLSKITLQLASASTTVWNSTSTIAANLGTVYLYKTDNSLVGSASIVSGATTADVTFSGLSVSLLQDLDTVLVVKANINAQDGITPRSVFAIQVKSTSTDMEVTKSSGGQLSAGSIVGSNAQSNFVITHAASPIVANSYTTTQTGGIGSNQQIGKFVVSNPGSREITLTSSTFAVALGGTLGNGATGTSTVDTFNIVDQNDLSVSFSGVGYVSASSTTANITFTLTSNNTIPAGGGSRTYLVRANTSAVRNGVSTGNPTVVVSLGGTRGYSASDITGPDELFWSDANLFYSYTTTGSNAQTYGANAASDSAPVDGVAFSF